MQTKQTKINHLIKTLAEQIRYTEWLRKQAEKQAASAKAATYKTVSQLHLLGVKPNDAFDKAEKLNGAIAA